MLPVDVLSLHTKQTSRETSRVPLRVILASTSIPKSWNSTLAIPAITISRIRIHLPSSIGTRRIDAGYTSIRTLSKQRLLQLCAIHSAPPRRTHRMVASELQICTLPKDSCQRESWKYLTAYHHRWTAEPDMSIKANELALGILSVMFQEKSAGDKAESHTR